MDFSKSAELFEQAQEVLAGGVSSGFRKNIRPLQYFERADGPYYYDVDGNEFVEYTQAWGPLIVGSNHPKINAAVSEQITNSYTLGAQHRLEIELAQKMVAAVPGVDQVIFSNTGSEAVQAALRISRASTGRDKFVKFEGHYHGWFNNVLVSLDKDGAVTGLCGGQPAKEYEDTIVLPWNDLDALRQLLEERGNEIACVLTEPILINGGSCMPNEGFLAGLIDLCKEHGVISIFDEVITGFRIALGGAREYFNLIPDLSVYAKAMAGGFTMSALGGKREVFDVLRSGGTVHFGTYNGTSHNLAAAIATLEILSEPGVHEGMHAHGYAIRERLEAAAKEHGHPMITTGVGAVFSMHFDVTEPPRVVGDIAGANKEKFAAFRGNMLENNILILPDGRWYIGAVHTDKELERTLTAIDASIAAL